MWGFLEKGRSLAERAANAAEAIEAQLNESVGVPPPSSSRAALSSLKQDDDEDDNDFEFESTPGTSKSDALSTPTFHSFRNEPMPEFEPPIPPPAPIKETVTQSPPTFQPLDTDEDAVVDDEDFNEDHEDGFGWAEDGVDELIIEEEEEEEEDDDDEIKQQVKEEIFVGENIQMKKEIAVEEDIPMKEQVIIKEEEETAVEEELPIETAESPLQTETQAIVEPMKTNAENIEAENIEAENIEAENVEAKNIQAKNIQAKNIQAEKQKIIKAREESNTIPPIKETLPTKVEISTKDINDSATTTINQAPTINYAELDKYRDALNEKNKILEDRNNTIKENEDLIHQFQSQILKLQAQLSQREQQLTTQASALSTVTKDHQAEKEQYETQLLSIKEEAKKRIARAKERVNEANSQLDQKDAIIKELRAEGEKLAMSTGKLEQSSRQAKSGMRELQESLDQAVTEKEKLTEKLKVSESTVTELRQSLSEAKKYQEKSTQLEHNLHILKEEHQTLKHTNKTMEQKMKELEASLTNTQKEATEHEVSLRLASNQEVVLVQKEKEELRVDLEKKIRLLEREANTREDSLRSEIEEIRKRWQDAVRRADSLSMDIQNATAPLLRQLQSTEKSMRIRASTWAETEEKIRKELEECILEKESLEKERNEYKSENSLMTRRLGETKNENEKLIDTVKNTHPKQLRELTDKVEELTKERDSLKVRIKDIQDELKDQSVKKHNEMAKSFVKKDEEIDRLTDLLSLEKTKRIELEAQLDDLVEQSQSVVGPEDLDPENDDLQPNLYHPTDQVEILKNIVDNEDDDREVTMAVGESSSSFAAMEQLNQGLKNAKQEIIALRQQLFTSEQVKNKIQADLQVATTAANKLPLFETKVLELTNDLVQREQELKSLHEDIVEIRNMYRAQLDALLEEKAAMLPKVPVVNVKEEEFHKDDPKRSADLDVNLNIAFNGDIQALC